MTRARLLLAAVVLLCGGATESGAFLAPPSRPHGGWVQLGRRPPSPSAAAVARGAAVVRRAAGKEPLPMPAGMPDGTTTAGIASMLEATFVKSCMQLANGYVDMLKLFISAALSGYEQGFTIPALLLELSQVSTQTAGRPLAQEEVDLRTVWLSLVYLVAENVGHPSKASGMKAAQAVGSTVPPEIRSQFCTFVYDVVNARRGGYTFEALKLEDLMRRSGDEKAKPMTELERAVLSQSMRICFLTLTVMDETALAKGDQPPKPNIPGI